LVFGSRYPWRHFLLICCLVNLFSGSFRPGCCFPVRPIPGSNPREFGSAGLPTGLFFFQCVSVLSHRLPVLACHSSVGQFDFRWHAFSPRGVFFRSSRWFTTVGSKRLIFFTLDQTCPTLRLVDKLGCRHVHIGLCSFVLPDPVLRHFLVFPSRFCSLNVIFSSVPVLGFASFKPFLVLPFWWQYSGVLMFCRGCAPPNSLFNTLFIAAAYGFFFGFTVFEGG